MSLIIMSLFFCFTAVHAQKGIDIKGGISFNTLTEPNFRLNTLIEPRLGWIFGVNYSIYKWQRISLNTGAEILEKNFMWHRTGQYSSIYEKHRNTYVSIPMFVSANLNHKQRLKLFVNSGVVYSYWITRIINGVTPNAFNTSTTIFPEGEVVQNFHLTSYRIKNDFHSNRDRRHEISVFIGLMAKYENSRRVIPTLLINYHQGLTSILNDNFSNLLKNTNSTFTVSGGASIILNRIK